MKLMLALGAALAAAPHSFAAAPSAAPQGSTLDLSVPSEDDGAADAAFVAGGAEIVVLHRTSKSLTRMDIASGTVLERIELGGFPDVVVADESAGRVLVLDPVDLLLHVVTWAPFTLERTIALDVLPVSTVVLAEGTDSALIVGTRETALVDLGTGISAPTVDLPNFVATASALDTPGVILSPDGSTLVRPAGTFGSYELQRVDAASGALLGSVPLPLSLPSQLFPSPDRSSFVVVGAGAVVRSYDTRTLALRAERMVPGATNPPVVLGVTDERAVVAGPGELRSVPFDPLLPVVTRARPAPFGVLGQGETHLAMIDFSGSSLLHLETLDELPVGPGVQFGLTLTSAVAAGDRFALLNLGRWDTLDVVETTPLGLVDRLVGADTGLGDEIDGPFQAAPSPIRGRSLLLAEGSSNLLEVDCSAPAAVTRTLELPGPPLEAAEMTLAGGSRLLVGTGTGNLAVVDPRAMALTANVTTGGEVIEIIPAPGAPEAWARLRFRSGFDELVRVDLGSPVPAVTSRISLGGTLAALPALTPWRRSVMIDHPRGRAYVVHDAEGEIEIVDLATAQVLSTIRPGPPPSAFGSPTQYSLDLSGDGSFLVRASEAPQIVGIDVSGANGTTLWSRTYGMPNPIFGRGFRAELTATDGAIVTTLRASFGGLGLLGPGLAALDPATGDVIDALPLIVRDFVLSGTGDVLAADGSDWIVARFDGSSFVELGRVATPGVLPGALHAEPADGTALLIELPFLDPFAPEPRVGCVDLIGGRTTELCGGGAPGLLGTPARLDPGGWSFAGGTLPLEASGLIPGLFALAAFGDMSAAPTPIAGSLGRLCLGGQLGRLSGQLQAASGAGTARFQVDTRAIPLSSGILVAAAPGSSWTFQVWHRDLDGAGTPTSNTTNAVRVAFR